MFFPFTRTLQFFILRVSSFWYCVSLWSSLWSSKKELFWTSKKNLSTTNSENEAENDSQNSHQISRWCVGRWIKSEFLYSSKERRRGKKAKNQHRAELWSLGDAQHKNLFAMFNVFFITDTNDCQVLVLLTRSKRAFRTSVGVGCGMHSISRAVRERRVSREDADRQFACARCKTDRNFLSLSLASTSGWEILSIFQFQCFTDFQADTTDKLKLPRVVAN